ncbi:MAG: hypothetical protein ACRDKL_06490, partial [Solirubrobacteraceae bacterium]
MSTSVREPGRGGDRPLHRVGHAFVRAGDDLATLGERLAAGAWDLVELDVLASGGELLVAHDAADLLHPRPVRLADALAALRELLPAHVGIVVDLKATGFEAAVLNQLRRSQLVQR